MGLAGFCQVSVGIRMDFGRAFAGLGRSSDRALADFMRFWRILSGFGRALPDLDGSGAGAVLDRVCCRAFAFELFFGTGRQSGCRSCQVSVGFCRVSEGLCRILSFFRGVRF